MPVPIAGQHDGLNRDKGSGDQLAAQYRAHGINMLSERATHEPGGTGIVLYRYIWSRSRPPSTPPSPAERAPASRAAANQKASLAAALRASSAAAFA
jgi:hypothetical protein